MSPYSQAETKSIEVRGAPFAYREVGPRNGVPVVFLHHLTANLDEWDPRVIDGVGQDRHVIAFDNRGVGRSGGRTPESVAEMAEDAVAFIDALGLGRVDLLGFSLGGFVAQVIALERRQLVRRLILAGTAPAGGIDVTEVGAVLQTAIDWSSREKRHPKHFLFFSPSASGQKAADEYLGRLGERTGDQDAAVTTDAIQAQLAAITRWGQEPSSDLGSITIPVLVANGDDDVMLPTVNSFDLFRRLPKAKLSIFPNAGHGGVFEYYPEFVRQVRAFLDA
jgi:pimeloyl-ACP methyl ester carboxylesterase